MRERATDRCQLLGMNCNTPTDVTFSSRSFAQRGGRTSQHTDGWRIAFLTVTAPRASNEHWTALAPGELKVFEGGKLSGA